MYSKTSSGYPTHDCTSNDRAACPDTLPDFHDRATAQAEWTALAPLLSHSPVMRVSRDGGKTYPHRWVRQFTADTLLPMPTAVHLHDKHGCGRVLVLDLDHAAGTVAVDYTRLADTLDSLGTMWFADVSPSGGRHIYIPLDQALPHTLLADTARRLSARYPSIDPSPHNSADTGCIRPPGSVWKRGGHQRLITDFKDAIASASVGNPTRILDALTQGLPDPPVTMSPSRDDADVSPYLPTTGHHLSPRLSAIARTGQYDTDRYSSPSEARQAVITGAVRAGLTQIEVIRRVETGIWPGLAAMYRRYRTGQRKALGRDWLKAQRWLTHQPQSRVQSSTTSPQVTGGRFPSTETHTQLRQIERHLVHTEPPPTTPAARKRRYLLRALLSAAHQAGSLTLARGCRSLALASGIDHTHIPALLSRLCDEPDPLIRKVRDARGKDAAVYEFVPLAASASDCSPWSKGLPVHSLRPVFRVLGLTAADIYETLELHPALTGRAIARKTGHSPTTVLDVLALLAAHGLVRSHTAHGNTHWSTTMPQRCADAADKLGATAIVARLILRYRAERLTWWAWLTERAVQAQIEHIGDTSPSSPLWPPEPPPDWPALQGVDHVR